MSNAFTASIVRITAATTRNGATSGSVMKRKSCHSVAPSSRADSYGSVGSAASPPSTISITSGVQCQISTSTRLGMTSVGEYTHSDGGSPTSDSR